VTDTLTLMARKTVQVRIPADLGGDVAIVAAALDKTVPEYVEDAVRAAVAKDLPRAAQIAKERAEAVAGQPRKARRSDSST
jgi:predicted transcriptional regulator